MALRWSELRAPSRIWTIFSPRYRVISRNFVVWRTSTRKKRLRLTRDKKRRPSLCSAGNQAQLCTSRCSTNRSTRLKWSITSSSTRSSSCTRSSTNRRSKKEFLDLPYIWLSPILFLHEIKQLKNKIKLNLRLINRRLKQVQSCRAYSEQMLRKL